MNIFSRYLIYLCDCAVMLAIIGLQLWIFRGEFPFQYDSDRWLELLLDNRGSVFLTTLIGGTIYWLIVDYHPQLVEYRRSRVVSTSDDSPPDFGIRFIRSFVKAFTMFSAPFLLLFALFSDGHRFLHDYLAQTRRVRA